MFTFFWRKVGRINAIHCGRWESGLYAVQKLSFKQWRSITIESFPLTLNLIPLRSIYNRLHAHCSRAEFFWRFLTMSTRGSPHVPRLSTERVAHTHDIVQSVMSHSFSCEQSVPSIKTCHTRSRVGDSGHVVYT